MKGNQSCVRSLQHEVTRTHVKDIVANPLFVNPVAIHNPTDFSSCFCNPCVSVRSNLLFADNVSSCNSSTMSLNSCVSHTSKDKSKSNSGSLCQPHCSKKTHSTFTQSQFLSTSNACIQTDFIRTSVSCIQTALCQSSSCTQTDSSNRVSHSYTQSAALCNTLGDSCTIIEGVAPSDAFKFSMVANSHNDVPTRGYIIANVSERDHSELRIVPAHFNGHLDVALIDTGSAFTILTKDYRHLLVDRHNTCRANFHAANGSAIKVAQS